MRAEKGGVFLLDFFFFEGGGDEWKRMETQIIGKPFTLHSSSFPPHFLTVIFQTFVEMVGVQELGTFGQEQVDAIG